MKEHGADILRSEGMQAGKTFRHHGDISVYRHSLEVAMLSIHIAESLNIRVDERSLVRGALLHDYYLYDWHIPAPEHRLHGFVHPGIAYRNAKEVFILNEREADIIRKHMFPMTLIPPVYREGWIVCIADKITAVRDYAKQWNPLQR